MEIDINQQKISVGDRYQIFTNAKPTHTAERELFKLRPIIRLFENGSSTVHMTITKRFAWLKAKYDIQRRDNNILEFRTVSFLKSQYTCPAGNDDYDIYGHRGRKYSIYKNDSQVAWWDKRAVSWFAGDNYKIIADDDCDASLIISFCLIVDNFSSNDHNGTALTINLGNIGFGAKKFDKDWQPKALS